MSKVGGSVGGSGDVDDTILRGAQAGDERALECFVRHYERAIFAFISRSMGRGPHVEDIAQDVFLRVIRALPRFEKREAKISTWIFQVAVRLMQDHRKRARPQVVPLFDEVGDRRPSPEESCARRRLLTRVEVLVHKLPADQRVALVLSEFHGMSHAEIADVTGARVATVKTRIFRARKFLRDAIEGQRGGES